MAPTSKMPKKARRRVLVVDDDPLVRNLLTAVLHDADFELDEAVDGADALRIAAIRPPDVVVLDVMMPGLNGYEVCRTLRGDPAFAQTRIVILTAKSAPGVQEDALRAGADAFFTKPFSPLDLIETVMGAHNGAA
ncbi:MAG: response regulator transcription factor [Actinomycetota bacterium]